MKERPFCHGWELCTLGVTLGMVPILLLQGLPLITERPTNLAPWRGTILLSSHPTFPSDMALYFPKPVTVPLTHCYPPCL